ncbi:MAG: plastocyanin/azurin family copper-binding protein [Actinomycetota bacterium]|jgi:nitrite reductase (NO-forming)|nr:MAG: hypothetical protein FD127_2100 [Acidimicrobiaceae bacterium]
MYKTLHRFGAVALAVSAAAVLAACGGGGDEAADVDGVEVAAIGDGEPAAAGVTINLSGKEFAFDQVNLTASAGSAFTVEFANAGLMEHDFTIEGQESAKIAAAPGAKASGTYTLAPGTYKFTCSVPGHEASGMVGTLTIG